MGFDVLPAESRLQILVMESSREGAIASRVGGFGCTRPYPQANLDPGGGSFEPPDSAFHDVAFFAVQRQIESLALCFRTHSQADEYVADFQNDEGAGYR